MVRFGEIVEPAGQFHEARARRQIEEVPAILIERYHVAGMWMGVCTLSMMLSWPSVGFGLNSPRR